MKYSMLSLLGDVAPLLIFLNLSKPTIVYHKNIIILSDISTVEHLH